MRYGFKILIFLIGLAIPVLGQVNVSLPDTSGDYQTVINIPVYSSDLTGYNVTQYNFKVKFDGNILEAQDVKVDGTLSDKITWTVTPTIKQNSIEVNADGVFALSGNGVLVYLTFQVKAQSGFTDLSFDNFTFNSGSPSANTKDGSFTVNEKATLNLISAGDGEGQVYVNGTAVSLPYTAEFPKGETVELYAEAAVSSNFTGWTGDIQTSQNPVYVVMDSDKSITANFNLKEFTITTSSNPVDGGSTSGGGIYKYGAQATVSATPNEGWDFINWTENGVEVSNTPDYTFTVDSDRVLVANFQKHIYTISTASNPAEGGTTIGDGQYQYGSQVTVTAFPNDTYDFVNWTENNIIVSTDSQYTFVVTSDRSLIANFEKRKFTVKTSSNPAEGGTTSGDGRYEQGSQVTVTATPATGYQFKNWTENDKIVSTDSQYTFIITSNRNLVANFDKIKYNVLTSASPQEGGATSGDGQYFYGDNVTVSAVPATGYRFKNWTENNIIVSTSKNYTFTITSNRNLVAHFKKIRFTVTTSANPQNGGSTSGDGQYYYGDNVTVTATPNVRYVFEYWTENNIIVSTNSEYSFIIESNRNLVANFEIKAFTISANPIPAEGGSVSGTGNYKYGETATLRAIANYGYKFVEWRENGSVVSTDSILTFPVESNRTFDAIFSEMEFSVSCAASPPEGGITSGCGIFKYKQTATLKTTPYPGWRFINWTDGDGKVLSDKKEFNLTVTKNIIAVANYEVELYTLTCMPNPPDAGFTSGCGVFKYGQTAQLRAVAGENWKFVYWSDSTGDTLSTDSSFSYVVQSDEELIANFTTLTGIENLESEGEVPDKFFVANNYPNPFNPSTVIKFGVPFTSVVTINIFNVNGQLVKRLIDGKTLAPGFYKYNFDAGNLSSGIYFYRIVARSLQNEQNIQETRKMILLK